MKGEDMRYCHRCGAEYDALKEPNGHKCDPRDLEQAEHVDED